MGLGVDRVIRNTIKPLFVDWEKENNILLPDGYRSFLLLANGFRNHGTEIYSLEQITQLGFPEDYKGYYVIGSYIGDGSLILVDDKG